MSWRADINDNFLPAHGAEAEAAWIAGLPAEDRARLRPVAEVLALLDGNAFFGADASGLEWWEQYLPEAHALFESNGGMSGWAGMASFAKEAERS